MMQLAASQRAHPPPVPPRPSRQVVAEALKRSPRPPCPTRQAPAPPANAKPWRSEDHETKRDGGRTLIYESQKDSTGHDEIRSASEPRTTIGEQQRAKPRDENVLPRRRSNDEIFARGSHNICREYSKEKIVDNRASREPSERYDEVENHRERHDRRCDEKKSELQQRASGRDNENDELSSRERTSQKTNRQSEVCKLGPVEEKNFENEKKTRENDACRRNGDAITRNSETRLGESVNNVIAKTAENENRDNDARCGEIRSAKNSEGHATRTPTPRVPRVKSDDADLKRNESKSLHDGDDPIEMNYGSAATVSSDDCTTVVVIDEPERKIAFNEDNDNIHHRDWLEAGVRYSSTKITLSGDEGTDRSDESFRINEDRKSVERSTNSNHDFASIRDRIAMSSLQGLPPLPRSLSGFNLNEGRREAGEPPPPPTRSSSKTPKNVKSTQPSSSKPSPPGRQLTTLDTQLAILRKEMFGLRQLDLSLLSQLWSLNESIQEFRQLLQEQEDRAPSPSPSSEEGDDTSYGSHPPPPPRRPAPLLHHSKPPRPPRPLRPPASDESPSSEEYGAV